MSLVKEESYNKELRVNFQGRIMPRAAVRLIGPINTPSGIPPTSYESFSIFEAKEGGYCAVFNVPAHHCMSPSTWRLIVYDWYNAMNSAEHDVVYGETTADVEQGMATQIKTLTGSLYSAQKVNDLLQGQVQTYKQTTPVALTDFDFEKITAIRFDQRIPATSFASELEHVYLTQIQWTSTLPLTNPVFQLAEGTATGFFGTVVPTEPAPTGAVGDAYTIEFYLPKDLKHRKSSLKAWVLNVRDLG
jgi:hypothetical protein